QIPYDARVLEVGCGTGQLSHFLGMAQRTVLGIDLCANSLRLAQQFKKAHGLERVAFGQMNLFRPALRKGFFDVVLSNGVLHHSGNAKPAFQSISQLAKPGGLVVVGLYNAFGRKLHRARQTLLRWTGLGRWLDPQAKKGQAHPCETHHTLDQVLAWMDEAGLEFVNSIPKPVPWPGLHEGERLFEAIHRGNRFTRVLSQLVALGSGYPHDGYFLVIGRRRLAAAASPARL